MDDAVSGEDEELADAIEDDVEEGEEEEAQLFDVFFWGYFLGEGFSGQCLLVVGNDELQPRYHVFVPLT